MSRSVVTYVSVVCATLAPVQCAELTSETRKGFDTYVAQFEATWKRGLGSPIFLSVETDGAEKSRVKNGEALIRPRRVFDSNKPADGLIQDWIGSIFLPRTNLGQVRSTMQDYANYKAYFKPEVTDSRLVGHHGNDFEVFLRLYKRHLVTVVLNTTYAIQYGSPEPTRLTVLSRSTRVAEVSDPKQSLTKEEPIGNDNGYLWALNSYWRFEEADGGVYGECEAISLSRDVPFGLGWAIKGFLDKFPKESMENTLAGVKRAVAAHQGGN